MIILRLIFLLVCAIPIGYTALRLWRRRFLADPTDRSAGFRPRIGFTRLDGMESISLLLENKSRAYVWAEEIEIFLSDLTADQQTTHPSCHQVQKIRQMVQTGDVLAISLAEIIYKAAGDPQRRYSCVLSSLVHYRIGEEHFDKNLENYRIQMIGLTASGIRRERKPVQPFPARKSENVQVLPAQSE